MVQLNQNPTMISHVKLLLLSSMQYSRIYVPQNFLQTLVSPSYMSILSFLSLGWNYTMHAYNSARYDEYIFTYQLCIQLFKLIEAGTSDNVHYV